LAGNGPEGLECLVGLVKEVSKKKKTKQRFAQNASCLTHTQAPNEDQNTEGREETLVHQLWGAANLGNTKACKN